MFFPTRRCRAPLVVADRAERGPRPAEPVWWLSIRSLDVFMRLVGRLEVHGADRIPHGSALLVANHVSWLDPLALLVAVHRSRARKIRFVALPSLFEAPVVGWFLRAGKHIPAYDGVQARRTLRAVLKALEGGELVLVYPEGGIPRPGQTLAPAAGVGVLLRRIQAPVVPIVTRGLERRARWYAGRRHAAVLVGEPIPTYPSQGRARPAELAHEALAAVCALHRELTVLDTARSAGSAGA